MNTPAKTQGVNPVSAAAVSDTPLLPADPMISMIERMAVDPASDLDKLERMIALKERHDAANAKALADEAFALASAEFPAIPLKGKNTHNGQQYAKLEDIIGKTRPILSKYGLALSFSTEVTDKDVIVTAELAHKGGHTRTNSLPLPRDLGSGRNAVQAVGSSQTYGQRYTAQAILGLSLGEDTEDDGASCRAAPKAHRDTWAQTIVQDLHPNATDRDKAEAIADALEGQWKRKKSVQQLANEWTRREVLIEGELGLEGRFPSLYANVLTAYEVRMSDLKEGAS